MTRSKRLWIALLTLLLVAAMGLVCYAADGDKNEITSVRINKKLTEVEIKAALTADYIAERSGNTVYLFGFLPYQSVSDMNDMEPIATAKVGKAPTFRIDFDRDDVLQPYTKYAVAEKTADGRYTLLTGARYIENPEAVAKRSYGYPEASSKKGLSVQLLTDAQELNVSHTVMVVPVNEYIMTSGGNNSQDYLYDNKTFYVNKEKLALLDKRIKVLTESGVHVYLNIVLTAPKYATSEALHCMYAAEETSEAGMYALNIKSRESVMYYQSFLSFLAERYTREDGKYGFAGSYIIGYQVNSNRNWNYMGEQSLTDYLNAYAVTLRIADTALRSTYAEGRIYVPVGNNFNVMANDTGAEPNNMLDYAAKDFLMMLNSTVKFAGDIPWNVAIAPYFFSEGSAAFWNDESSYADYTTPYITMKNIGTLTEFLAGEDFDYNGTDRTVLISSYGVHSADDIHGEKMQAAAYAYAYYLAEADPNIEAIIYHRHVDHSGENGLKYGLWRSDDGLLLTPKTKKYIYDVFKYIDTDRGREVTEFAPSFIGAAGWDQLLPGDFDIGDAAQKTVIDTVAVSREAMSGKYEEQVWFDFSGGTYCGFYPTDNVEYIELREMSIPETNESGVILTEVEGDTMVKLYAKLFNLERFGYMGVGNYFDAPVSLKNIGYLSAEVKVDAPEDVTGITVMLRMYSGDIIYSAVTQIAPNNWQTLYFDLSALTGATDTVDGIKLWVKPYDDRAYSGDFGLWMGNVSLYAKGASMVGTVLLIMLFVVLGSAAAVVIFILVRYFLYQNRRKKLMERRRRLHNARQMQSPEGYSYPSDQPFDPGRSDHAKARKVPKAAKEPEHGQKGQDPRGRE